MSGADQSAGRKRKPFYRAAQSPANSVIPPRCTNASVPTPAVACASATLLGMTTRQFSDALKSKLPEACVSSLLARRGAPPLEGRGRANRQSAGGRSAARPPGPMRSRGATVAAPRLLLGSVGSRRVEFRRCAINGHVNLGQACLQRLDLSLTPLDLRQHPLPVAPQLPDVSRH
jgi:hypothetical protein